ncbi:GPW/gp25 family protein [Pseudogulbenkiania ferrooxidans]|uniref:Baseplate protein n=1 Tax=Pseudogulbenkiania ferrooxidans EGD-HP2 TaxID=1388764 RepID=A0ABN0N7H2_9NEIS|nr:GPW/gp25 family protein [Pseudogulbenkiania ferrooxidans]ERE07147.1 baseplate protein [Pseudogulbenkiania ferrooxidans EGD-HP2]
MKQLPEILSADWSPQLGALGEVVEDVADIDQCIRIILTTQPGTDPLRPLFGCDVWRWLDAPVDIALPHVVREVYAAIGMWEPRAEVVGVTLSPGDGESHWRVRVNWQPAGAPSQRQTEVSYV